MKHLVVLLALLLGGASLGQENAPGNGSPSPPPAEGEPTPPPGNGGRMPPQPPQEKDPPQTPIDLSEIVCAIISSILKINICEFRNQSHRYHENYQFRFLPSVRFTLEEIDDRSESGRERDRTLNEELKEMGRKPIPELREHEVGKRMASDALKDEPPPAVINKALTEATNHYRRHIESLESQVVEPYRREMDKRMKRHKELEEKIRELRQRLGELTPGSAEAASLVEEIRKLEDEWYEHYKDTLRYVRKEYPRLMAAAHSALGAAEALEETRSQIRRAKGLVGSAGAVNKIVEHQRKEINSTIRKVEKIAETLVEDAYKANSTRAATVLVVEALANLMAQQVHVQSVLHQALMELAQQNVYTNESLLALGNEMAAQMSRQISMEAQKAQQELAIMMGKMETLEDSVTAWRQAVDRRKNNPCRDNWFWNCSFGTLGQFGRDPNAFQWR